MSINKECSHQKKWKSLDLINTDLYNLTFSIFFIFSWCNKFILDLKLAKVENDKFS